MKSSITSEKNLYLNFVISHPKHTTIAIALIVFLFWVIFPHRSRWKALKSKKYSCVASNKIFALRTIKRLFFVEYNRSKTVTDFTNDLNWFNETYSANFMVVSPIEWVRFLGFDGFMMLKEGAFDKNVYVNESLDPYKPCIARDGLGKTISIDTSDVGEVFISGASQSGKTTIAKRIIDHVLRFQGTNAINGKEARAVVATSKPQDFIEYNPIDTSDNYQMLLHALQRAVEELKRRKNELVSAGVTHSKMLGELPYVLVIDEAHHVLKRNKSNPIQIEICDLCEKIIREGAAHSILLIVISQKAQKSELDISLREGIVISGRQDSTTISEELFGTALAAKSILQGGILMMKDKCGIQIIKGASRNPNLIHLDKNGNT